MPEFGRRQRVPETRSTRGGDPPPPDVAGAIAAVASGKLPAWTQGGPGKLVVLLALVGTAAWYLFLPYAGGLLRDARLAGTWQAAYDMQAVEGGCTRYQHVLTLCRAKLRSLPEPGREPVTIAYMMLFSGGGGEALVPVRSTADPSAVTVAYAAETQLMNRALTMLAIAICIAGLVSVVLHALVKGRYAGGAAHRALLAGLEDLQARAEAGQAGTRAAS